jgi:hypothetical protein
VNGNFNGNSGFNKRSRVKIILEKTWPIGEQLKNNKAEDLFQWIGKCIAEVVQDGNRVWGPELREELPLGVTFSFPMMSVPPLLKFVRCANCYIDNIRYQKLHSCPWVKDSL